MRRPADVRTTVCTPRNIKWGRSYEGFGEEPIDNINIGLAEMRGEQGNGNINQNTAIACCIKHYMGDGGTGGGVNAGIDSLTDSTMRALHFPQYVYGAREGAATVMPSYSAWYRKPSGPSFRMTVDSIAVGRMLKREAASRIYHKRLGGRSQACGTTTQVVSRQAVNAGLDMAMVVGGTNPGVWINSIVYDFPAVRSRRRASMTRCGESCGLNSVWASSATRTPIPPPGRRSSPLRHRRLRGSSSANRACC